MRRARTNNTNGGTATLLKSKVPPSAAYSKETKPEPIVKKTTAKRTLTKPHEAFAIVLDVGSNSAQNLCGKEGDIDLTQAKKLLDWVFARKIFIESTDRFSLIFFGHEATRNNLDYKNIYIHNDEYETTRMEWLKMLENEVDSNMKNAGDYIEALFVALESLRAHNEGVGAKEIANLNIIFLSNFAGIEDEDLVKNSIVEIIEGFRLLNAQLIVIGPDLSSNPKSQSQKIGFEFIKEVLEAVDGLSYSYSQGFNSLTFFVPKSVAPRGQPFTLELGQDFGINVQMFVKNSEASMKFIFDPVASSSDPGKESTSLVKVRGYEAADSKADEMKINLKEIDQLADEDFTIKKRNFLETKVVDKADVIKGYRFGNSLVPIANADAHLMAFPREGKQLQLLQFTKLTNILPQFILSNSRYLLPPAKDQASLTAFSALVEAMLKLEVVALCRYAYSSAANPKVACLIPKISKTGIPVSFQNSKKDYQLDLIDEYIDSMLLSKSDGSEEKLRCKNVNNPKHQYQCQVVREKALHPDREFPEVDRKFILKFVSPPDELVEKSRDIAETLKDAFSLERNPYTKVSTFKTKIPEETIPMAKQESVKDENDPEKMDFKY